MRKTIELSKDRINKVENFKKEKKLKSFSDAIREMIDNQENLSDDNFALLADAILKLDKKLDVVVGSIAPKHAGEVNKV